MGIEPTKGVVMLFVAGVYAGGVVSVGGCDVLWSIVSTPLGRFFVEKGWLHITNEFRLPAQIVCPD